MLQTRALDRESSRAEPRPRLSRGFAQVSVGGVAANRPGAGHTAATQHTQPLLGRPQLRRVHTPTVPAIAWQETGCRAPPQLVHSPVRSGGWRRVGSGDNRRWRPPVTCPPLSPARSPTGTACAVHPHHGIIKEVLSLFEGVRVTLHGTILRLQKALHVFIVGWNAPQACTVDTAHGPPAHSSSSPRRYTSGTAFRVNIGAHGVLQLTAAHKATPQTGQRQSRNVDNRMSSPPTKKKTQDGCTSQRRHWVEPSSATGRAVAPTAPPTANTLSLGAPTPPGASEELVRRSTGMRAKCGNRAHTCLKM